MSRKIYLLKYPAQPRQRSHFGIWVPSDERGCTGKIIQVLGTPFTGFDLEFQRGYDLRKALPKPTVVELGAINAEFVLDSHNQPLPDKTPLDKLESVATFVSPPRASKNPLVVDEVENKRCQEWTAEFVDQLVLEGMIDPAAKQVLAAHRDGLTPSAPQM